MPGPAAASRRALQARIPSGPHPGQAGDKSWLGRHAAGSLGRVCQAQSQSCVEPPPPFVC
ncbi:hypothetical protein E2C01_069523 [Portunus trituberculatus]|uniref:Uncharacterized protein n=1 Tax=Portunus trituberculatus TaxID=210409 RepID=A0A5B7I2K6_PORTR|nr:hypothetical protein [Portunus trituberculatus]